MPRDDWRWEDEPAPGMWTCPGCDERQPRLLFMNRTWACPDCIRAVAALLPAEGDS